MSAFDHDHHEPAAGEPPNPNVIGTVAGRRGN
jgi:hypothetical protein